MPPQNHVLWFEIELGLVNRSASSSLEFLNSFFYLQFGFIFLSAIYDLSSKSEFNCQFRIQGLQHTPLCMDYWYVLYFNLSIQPHTKKLLWLIISIIKETRILFSTLYIKHNIFPIFTGLKKSTVIPLPEFVKLFGRSPLFLSLLACFLGRYGHLFIVNVLNKFRYQKPENIGISCNLWLKIIWVWEAKFWNQ